MPRVLLPWCAALLLCAGWAGADGGRPGAVLPTVRALVGDQSLVAEVPVTLSERFRGLSGRAGLEPGRAMLFSCKPPQVLYMHMRGMLISLDFLWVASGRVIGITSDVPPAPRAPATISPPGPVDLVLEVPAGWARAHGVAPGAPVRLGRHLGAPRADEVADLLADPVYREPDQR